MPPTENETMAVVSGMADKVTVQLPVSFVTHCPAAEPGYQLPFTVAPAKGLCFALCTVITTVADHESAARTRLPSRLPTCMLGGFTTMPTARALLLELPSTNFCVAINVWLPVGTLPVFQLKVLVALAPAAR